MNERKSYILFLFIFVNTIFIYNQSISNKVKLIGVSFILNNGAEKQADTDEYKLFRNPSLNRDISQTGKMQQKYLSFFLKNQYNRFFKNLEPKNIKIYTNQKLKCIMSGIVILTTLFGDYSYYFEEYSKSALPSSYLNQDKILAGIPELKINYENRKINSFYKNCKDRIVRNNSLPISDKAKEKLLMTINEFTKLVKESNYCIQTVLDIYDLILLNRVFKEIPLHIETESMMKKLVIIENYLNGYFDNGNPKSRVLLKIDKLLASEVIFKITKFVNNLVRCEIKKKKNLEDSKDVNNSDSCEVVMFNFYEKTDIVEVIGMFVNKNLLSQHLDDIIKSEDIFNLLYPQYSSYLALEVYINEEEKVFLKIIFNNENIIDIIPEFLYVQPDENILINGKKSYFAYELFTKQIIGRLNQNQVHDVNEIKEECKKLENEKIDLLFEKNK